MAKKASVEHFSDGREAWPGQSIGYFTRFRGIFISGLSTLVFTILVATGPPWWAECFQEEVIELPIKWVGVFSVALIGIILTAGLFYLRVRTIRSLQVKYLVHQIAHRARDIQTALGNTSEDVHLKDSAKDFVILVQEYFRELIGGQCEVAMRIAAGDDREVNYITLARTNGLNTGRDDYSEPLAADQGLARFLQSQSSRKGVLIYHDLKEAAGIGAWEPSKNDAKYPEDVETLMAAGMNAWDGQKDSMLGILYIISRENNVFERKHVDCLGFAADIAAQLISSIICKKQEVFEGGDS